MKQFYRNQALGLLFSELPSDMVEYDKEKDWDVFEEFCKKGKRDWHTIGFQLSEEYEFWDSDEVYAKALEIIDIQHNAVCEQMERNLN